MKNKYFIWGIGAVAAYWLYKKYKASQPQVIAATTMPQAASPTAIQQAVNSAAGYLTSQINSATGVSGEDEYVC